MSASLLADSRDSGCALVATLVPAIGPRLLGCPGRVREELSFGMWPVHQQLAVSESSPDLVVPASSGQGWVLGME